MALLHMAKKVVTTHQDAWADYTTTTVPFTGDDKPRLAERLHGALAAAGLVVKGHLPAIGMMTTRVEVKAADGVVVLTTRYPIGD